MIVNDTAPERMPFVLIAKLRVRADKLEEYLSLAQNTDDSVRRSEPGMLLHTFDVSPDDPCAFTWTEVYLDDAALIAHFNNPELQPYLDGHKLFGVGDIFVTIYGVLASETIEFLNNSGVPWAHHISRAGFAANFPPRELPEQTT